MSHTPRHDIYTTTTTTTTTPTTNANASKLRRLRTRDRPCARRQPLAFRLRDDL
jgi:hypothetical protein